MKSSLLVVMSLIFFTSFCDTANQLLLKSSINSLNISNANSVGRILRFVFKLVLTPKVWASSLFAVLSLCIWLVVLSKADLNFAFSVDSMHYILIAAASGLILREKVGLIRWFGTVLIVFGIFLVVLS